MIIIIIIIIGIAIIAWYTFIADAADSVLKTEARRAPHAQIPGYSRRSRASESMSIRLPPGGIGGGGGGGGGCPG
jgi:hypothetical protein